MKKIGKPVKENDVFLKREDFQKELIRKLTEEKKKISHGGGKKAVERIKAQKKLTARERVAKLIDPGSHFFEVNLHAAFEVYEEQGGAPAAGTVSGIGKIHEQDWMIIANDATVKAGAWFPITCKKNLRAQEIAIENRLPIVYLVDSAGVFLPLQEDIFPDKEHFGRIFRNNAVISAMGIPQISAIMGPCVAGGAYLPIMSDEALIVEGTGSVFLAGAHLVKAAIGEQTNNEELGGARVQSNVSGVTDYIVKNDEECIEQIRSLVSKISPAARFGFNRVSPSLPVFHAKDLLGLLPEEPLKPYDMYEVLARIVDDSELDEYKAGYGKTIITAYARIDGWAVGIVANQRTVLKTDSGEMQIGGVIYSDSADKAARFIMNCNQRKIPLLFLQDVTGFMVGTRAEHGGIIKDGAKMVNVVANSVVPKITIIIGNSFGAGNYAMCGKAYDPRFIFAFPNAKISVMGGSQAAQVLLDIKIKQLEKEGKTISDEDKQTLLQDIIRSYEKSSSPQYAAARLWVDDIVNPLEVRQVVSRCIEIADNNPEMKPFKTGVIQT